MSGSRGTRSHDNTPMHHELGWGGRRKLLVQEAYSKESVKIQVHAVIRFLDVCASGT